jgi:hypothetical protein
VGEAARDAWQQTAELLFAFEMERDDVEGVDVPRVVKFTPAAEKAWITFYDAHMVEMEDANLAESLKGHWSKLRAYAARLALVVHLLRLAAAPGCGPAT